MSMQQLTATQFSPEVPINENFDTLAWASVFGKRHPESTGLLFAWYGGPWGGLTIADGSVTLTNNATNYLVVTRTTGAVSNSTNTTNWDNLAVYARAYVLVTLSGVITSTTDHRGGPFGPFASENYVLRGSGSPESVVTAPIGTLYLRTNGGANTTLYVKESGTGSTGWIAK